jgi:hypothetical protein
MCFYSLPFFLQKFYIHPLAKTAASMLFAPGDKKFVSPVNRGHISHIHNE